MRGIMRRKKERKTFNQSITLKRTCTSGPEGFYTTWRQHENEVGLQKLGTGQKVHVVCNREHRGFTE